MLKVNRVCLTGFKCFKGTSEVSLEPNVNLFCGANGSGKLVQYLVDLLGKSSFLEAIEFVLGSGSNQLRSSCNKNLISDKEDGAVVTVHFCAGTRSFSVTRRVKRNGSTSFRFVCEGKGKKVQLRELTRILQDLGVDLKSSDRFVLRQCRTIELTEKSEVALLRFLEGLIGSDSLYEKMRLNVSKLQFYCSPARKENC